jgi:hypothetical protein
MLVHQPQNDAERFWDYAAEHHRHRDRGAFSQTNNCDASLGSGKFCTITVKWLMMNSAGTVSVSDNASGSPQTVSLEGLKECTPP